MTRRSPCTVVAMFSSLLATATPASAACAWVLWVDDESQVLPASASNTKEEC